MTSVTQVHQRWTDNLSKENTNVGQNVKPNRKNKTASNFLKMPSILVFGKYTLQQPFHTTWELMGKFSASQLSSIQIPLVTQE